MEILPAGRWRTRLLAGLLVGTTVSAYVISQSDGDTSRWLVTGDSKESASEPLEGFVEGCKGPGVFEAGFGVTSVAIPLDRGLPSYFVKVTGRGHAEDVAECLAPLVVGPVKITPLP